MSHWISKITVIIFSQLPFLSTDFVCLLRPPVTALQCATTGGRGPPDSRPVQEGLLSLLGSGQSRHPLPGSQSSGRLPSLPRPFHRLSPKVCGDYLFLSEVESLLHISRHGKWTSCSPTSFIFNISWRGVCHHGFRWFICFRENHLNYWEGMQQFWLNRDIKLHWDRIQLFDCSLVALYWKKLWIYSFYSSYFTKCKTYCRMRQQWLWFFYKSIFNSSSEIN